MLAMLKPKVFSIKQALREAVIALQNERIESASLDARILLEHVLRINREQLLLAMEEEIYPDQHAHYQRLISRRIDRQPISHLIGKREFFGLEFKVTADTLDPRPDSETIIEAVLERCKNDGKYYKILDLGTGSGCLLLSLLNHLPNATAIGVDISEAAIAVAKENTMCLGMQSRVAFLASNWCEKLAGTFDIIVANPPYIPTKSIELLSPEVARHEPRLALDGGEDGLDCYRKIMRELPRFLADGGIAVFEIGIGQERDLARLAEESGLKVQGMKQDLSGIIRAVIITKE